jgi:hypothetical protein
MVSDQETVFILRSLLTKVFRSVVGLINLVDVHPELRHKGHPVDGMLRGCWFTLAAVITEA